MAQLCAFQHLNFGSWSIIKRKNNKYGEKVMLKPNIDATSFHMDIYFWFYHASLLKEIQIKLLPSRELWQLPFSGSKMLYIKQQALFKCTLCIPKILLLCYSILFIRKD